jgi:hypothetical protein
MSDAGKEQREWRFYLDDMIAFAKKVQTYTDGLTQAEFTANGLTYDATLRNLELIGEAATHVPNEMSTANPDIPWRLVQISLKGLACTDVPDSDFTPVGVSRVLFIDGDVIDVVDVVDADVVVMPPASFQQGLMADGAL